MPVIIKATVGVVAVGTRRYIDWMQALHRCVRAIHTTKVLADQLSTQIHCAILVDTGNMDCVDASY